MRLACLLVFVICTSCSGLRGAYRTPAADLPEHWQGAALKATVSQSGTWWTVFGDPTLNALIERALERNNDLAAAAMRVRAARLRAELIGTNRTPDVSVEGRTSSSRDLRSGDISRSHSLTGSLSYEVDLWGKLAAARDAAEWEARATEEDRLNTRLSLIATVATTYWRIAYLNERIVQAEDSIATARETLRLVRARYAAGAVSGLELTQSLQNLATQEATLPALLEERSTERMAMSLLFDQAPQRLMPEQTALPAYPLPEIGAGIPADVLRRRPDLLAAELRLRAMLADVDQARAALYPALTLTSSLGGSSLELRDVLDNPLATLGAGLLLPFVQWNSVKLNIDIAESTFAEAVIAFRQTLYDALNDVEKALAARERYESEHRWREESLTLARAVEDLTEKQYRSGAVSLQDWLETQDSRRAAEIAVSENRLNRLTSTLTLLQALGGEAR